MEKHLFLKSEHTEKEKSGNETRASVAKKTCYPNGDCSIFDQKGQVRRVHIHASFIPSFLFVSARFASSFYLSHFMHDITGIEVSSTKMCYPGMDHSRKHFISSMETKTGSRVAVICTRKVSPRFYCIKTTSP